MGPKGQCLVQYIGQSLKDEEEFHFLRFEFLQRLNIAQLQLDLVRLRSSINRSRMISDDNRQVLQTKLKDYGANPRIFERAAVAIDTLMQPGSNRNP